MFRLGCFVQDVNIMLSHKDWYFIWSDSKLRILIWAILREEVPKEAKDLKKDFWRSAELFRLFFWAI